MAVSRDDRGFWVDFSGDGQRVAVVDGSSSEALVWEVASGVMLARIPLDDDTGDLDRLTEVALAYRRAGIPLHVVGLDPSPEDAELVRRLLADPSALVPAPAAETPSTRFLAGTATQLALATVALALALGALLVVTQRVRWRSP